jgi:hypothetical protein
MDEIDIAGIEAAICGQAPPVRETLTNAFPRPGRPSSLAGMPASTAGHLFS